MTDNKSWTFEPIARFKCSKQNPIDAAQQGALDQNAIGTLDLGHFPQWQQMLENLQGFSHLWLVFVFHKHSQKWKPKVWPPRSPKKIGVFATRSPYRPNPIGLSAVELILIEGSTLHIRAHDLLDGTPILDIKPYIAYSDSWPQASNGWLDECAQFEIEFSELVNAQIKFLKEHDIDLSATIQQQLGFSPTAKKKKRVSVLDEANQIWILSIKTWRVKWQLHEKQIQILQIFSGYSAMELSNEAILSSDPYKDKKSHLAFQKAF